MDLAEIPAPLVLRVWVCGYSLVTLSEVISKLLGDLRLGVVIHVDHGITISGFAFSCTKLQFC